MKTRARGYAFVTMTVIVAAACAGPSAGSLDRVATTRAPAGAFQTAGVSTVFEKHCGSLDCHGSTARNMRIYSSDGLRLPNEAGLSPGVGSTTLDEVFANYESVLTVEPEQTNYVLGGGDPYSLLILKKPLGIEAHKGGQVLRRGDDAEQCIVTWLTTDALTKIDTTACTNAAIFPKP